MTFCLFSGALFFPKHRGSKFNTVYKKRAVAFQFSTAKYVPHLQMMPPYFAARMLLRQPLLFDFDNYYNDMSNLIITDS